MAEISLDTLHHDLTALRTEMRTELQTVRTDLIRLEAKIDSKPSLMAMFTGIIIVVFGMSSVIGTTVAVLASLHLFK